MSGLKRLFKGNAVAFRYALYSLVLLLAVFFIIDSFVIPTLEDQGKVVSTAWKKENDKLLRFMRARNQADPSCPVWRSQLFPVSVAKTKGKRILVMGDSFIWGHGYSNVNQIWWRQLQLELERRGYHDVEVIGAGLNGAPTSLELGWAKKLVPQYRPDLVIWGYVTNDPGENDLPGGASSVKALTKLPKDKSYPERLSLLTDVLFPNLSEQLASVRKKRREEVLAGDIHGYQAGDWELKILEGHQFQFYKQIVKDVAAFCHDSSAPAFVMTLPNCVTYACSSDGKEPAGQPNFFDNIRRYYSSRYAPVQSAFASSGMTFYNNLDDFITYAAAQTPPGAEAQKFNCNYMINPVNSHPGPMATHFYAIKAADFIEANYKDVLGKRTLELQPAAPTVVINDCVPPDIDVRQNTKLASFVYPDDEDDLLSMPMRKPYVLLNLERTVPLKEIKLTGLQLKEADVYLTWQPTSKHYDDGPPVELGLKKGSYLCWSVPQNRSAEVSAIRIRAKFKGSKHGVLLSMIPVTSAKPSLEALSPSSRSAQF